MRYTLYAITYNDFADTDITKKLILPIDNSRRVCPHFKDFSQKKRAAT